MIVFFYRIKYKNIILVFLLFNAFLLGLITNIQAKNYIPNSGFEITTVQDMPDAWDQYLGPKMRKNWRQYWRLDSQIKYDGVYSLRLSNDQENSIVKIYAESYLRNVFTKSCLKKRLSNLLHIDSFTKDKVYTLSLFMKSDKDHLKVKVKFFGQQKYFNVDKQWKRYVFSAPFKNSYRILVALYDIGTLWIDNVQLEEGPSATDYEDSIFPKDFFAIPEPQTRADIQSELNSFISSYKSKPDTITSKGKVYIDPKKRQLIVNGRPFFYFGACFSAAHLVKDRWKELLQLIKRHGYTVVIASFAASWNDTHASNEEIQDFLDLADSIGFKVVVWISPSAIKVKNGKYQRVRELPAEQVLQIYKKEASNLISHFKNHPALLAWYVCDEPWRQSWIEISFAKKLVDYAKTLDSEHPVFINYANPKKHFKFLGGFIPGDIISQTMYPVPCEPLTTIALDAYRDFFMGNKEKPVFFWHQLWGGKGRYPTPNEFRAMVYLAAIYGATGFQTWPMMPGSSILWDSVKNVINEMKTIQPFLYSNNNEMIKINSGDYIFAKAKKIGQKLYIVSINVAEKRQNAEIKIDYNPKKCTVVFEARNISLNDGTLRDTFLPYARHVYECDLSSESVPIGAPRNLKILK